LFTGWVMIDTILSAAIALMIFWSSYLVIREAVVILMEATPAGVGFDSVHKVIASIPGAKGVHDLHIWSLSSYEAALSCHVCVDRADVSRGPEVVAEINRFMREKFGIGHCTIQIECEECGRSSLLCGLNGEPSKQS
jgi:cobalt-zinc-cadmium efflux system protein